MSTISEEDVPSEDEYEMTRQEEMLTSNFDTEPDWVDAKYGRYYMKNDDPDFECLRCVKSKRQCRWTAFEPCKDGFNSYNDPACIGCRNLKEKCVPRSTVTMDEAGGGQAVDEGEKIQDAESSEQPSSGKRRRGKGKGKGKKITERKVKGKGAGNGKRRLVRIGGVFQRDFVMVNLGKVGLQRDQVGEQIKMSWANNLARSIGEGSGHALQPEPRYLSESGLGGPSRMSLEHDGVVPTTSREQLLGLGQPVTLGSPFAPSARYQYGLRSASSRLQEVTSDGNPFTDRAAPTRHGVTPPTYDHDQGSSSRTPQPRVSRAPQSTTSPSEGEAECTTSVVAGKAKGKGREGMECETPRKRIRRQCESLLGSRRGLELMCNSSGIDDIRLSFYG